MTISYSSSLSRNGKGQTYGSGDDWLSNKHIAKAPHRALFTRQVDPFFQNSKFTQAFNDSGTRISEEIMPYARGVNPVVSISYGNADGRPVKLPNKILDNGAFRPPIRKIEELTPLSRLPYGNYSIQTQPKIQTYKFQNVPLNYKAIIEAKPLVEYKTNHIKRDYTPKSVLYVLDDPVTYSIETAPVGGKIAGAAPSEPENVRTTTNYSIETAPIGGQVAGAPDSAAFTRLDAREHYQIATTAIDQNGANRVPTADPTLAARRVQGDLFRAGGKTNNLADVLFSQGAQVDPERGKRAGARAAAI